MPSVSSQKLRAVILAAGKGKRMKSATPKVLHDLMGRTMLCRLLSSLEDVPVEKMHIVLGHGAEMVEDYLKENPPHIEYSTHLQKEQLGSGHALKQMIPVLKGFQGTLLVLPADAPLISSATIAALVAQHAKQKAAISLLTAVIPDPTHYGRILRDKHDAITGIVEEKDATAAQKSLHEVNSSVYCFDWGKIQPGLEELKNDNKQKEYYLPDLVSWAVNEGLKVASHSCADWREIRGVNSRYELAEVIQILQDMVCRRLTEEIGVTIIDPRTTWIAPEVKVAADTTILPGCYLVGDIEIGSNCRIGPHTVMHGKVIIGRRSVVTLSQVADSTIGADCFIGPFANLRNNVNIADNARIGNFVEVKQSKIGKGTHAAHLSYIGDAQLGDQVNIGAGTITANYNSITKVKSKTVLKNGVSTGSNSVLVAPVEVGENAMIAAGTVVTKDVPPRALAVGRAPQENKANWVKDKKK